MRLVCVVIFLLVLGTPLSAQQPQGSSGSGADKPDKSSSRIIHLSRNEIIRHIAMRRPALPDGLREASVNLDETMVVRLRFDSTGKVESLRFLSDPSMAGQMVLESLKNWTFTPVARNGKNCGGRGQLRIRYILHNGIATMTVEPDDQ
jgi:hypothetical protein